MNEGREAWKAWEEDEKTNPTPVNPHAFTYGYNIAKKKYTEKLAKERELRKELVRFIEDYTFLFEEGSSPRADDLIKRSKELDSAKQ